MSIVEKALRKFHADSKGKEQHAARVEPELVVGRLVTRPASAPSQPPPEPSPSHPQPQPQAAFQSTSTKMVCVDRGGLRASGLLPPESEERELSHQYRAIKRPLIRSAFEPSSDKGAPKQLIMVASALPGEGKTFTTINLALSMSLEKDHPVLLVDADVAKPHVSRVFGVEEEPGLLDMLADTSRPIDELLRSAILPTDVPGLSLLPAGHRSETASELLASARMGEILRHLAALYSNGIVLFDSPPILLTTEARNLASQVGQVIVVVKADSTPQQAIKDTIGLLEGAQGLRLVLNQADLSGPMGYYYGYNYGYAEQTSESGRSPPKT